MKKTTLAILLTSALASTPLLAAQHWEAGLGLGYGTIATSQPFNEGTTDFFTILYKDSRNQNITYRADIADWFDTTIQNLQLGIELGYTVQPSSRYNSILNGVSSEGTYTVPIQLTVNNTSTDLLAGARYYFNPKLFGTAQAGVAYSTQSNHYLLITNNGNLDNTLTKNATDLETVLGLGYQFQTHWASKIEYRRVWGQTTHSVASDAESSDSLDRPAAVNSLMLSINYLF